jgi:hypothetical protein
MSLYARRIAWVAGSLILLGSITGAALVGVSLVAGGSEPSPANFASPTQSPYGTPPPPTSPYPTQDPSRPTQPSDDRNRTPDPNAPTPFVPPFVTISGIDIPIPQGFQYAYGAAIADPGPGKPFYSIWMGASTSQQTGSGSVDSRIEFDDSGLVYAHVAPTDEVAFLPTLDALWSLTQKVAVPSTAFVTVKGQQIPLPAGSYYSTEETGLAENPLVYTVRLQRSVFWFDSRGPYGVRVGPNNDSLGAGVRPEDSASFQATVAALNSLVAP